MTSTRGVKESSLILNAADVVRNAETQGVLATYKVKDEKDNKVWVYKTNTSHQEDEIEASAGEFYKILLPQSPSFRTVYDETGYPSGVMSELDKNFFTANSYKKGEYQLPTSPEAVRKIKNGIAALACGLVLFDDNDEHQHENWAIHTDGTIVKVDHALTFFTMREGNVTNDSLDTIFYKMRALYKEFCQVIGMPTEKDAEIDALFYQPMFRLFGKMTDFSGMLNDHFTPERENVRDNINDALTKMLTSLFNDLLIDAITKGKLDLLKRFNDFGVDFIAPMQGQDTLITLALKSNEWKSVSYMLSVVNASDIAKISKPDLDLINKNSAHIFEAAKKSGLLEAKETVLSVSINKHLVAPVSAKADQPVLSNPQVQAAATPVLKK